MAFKALFDLLRKALQEIPFRSIAVEDVRERLNGLAERLATDQLQLAIVGQFKRGKSTLLNALIGAPVLPSAVTPLTAIPTFLRQGRSLELVTQYADGRQERHTTESIDQLRSLLFERVTEDGNPRNRAGISRVDAYLNSPLLTSGIVLIDTPGIGSTNLHNTEAARAALPECDMALFVVSPDPPITEAELIYLREIKQVSTEIIIVLNKIDLVEGDDRDRSEQFLSDTVLQSAGISTGWFFSVSARNAMAAKGAQDELRVKESGLYALESYILTFAQTRQREVLEAAVAKKGAALIAECIFEIDARLAMLQMPVSDLSDRLSSFITACTELEKEKRNSQDLLTGDRARLLSDLDQRADALRSESRDRLLKHANNLLAQGKSESDIAVQFEIDVPELFQAQFETFESHARAALLEILGEHQERGDRLITTVRRLAANLLDISFSAPIVEDALQPNKVPYWVTAPREFSFATPNIIETLLPATVRLDRSRERLRRHIDGIVTRNVENLRWALRQSFEMTVRIFQSRLDEKLTLAEEATRSAMQAAIEKRSRAEGESASEIEESDRAKGRLTAMKARMEEFV